MRRTHWWGIAAGVVALAGATLVAPSAMAAGTASPHKPPAVTSATSAPHVAKPPKAAAKPAKAAAKSRHGHGKPGRHGHKPPEYPPGRGASVSIDIPTRAHKGQRVAVGTKVAYNKQGLAGVKVALYNSNNNGAGWKLIDTTTTDAQGKATFSYVVNHDALVRIVVAGSDASKASQSESVKITVKK